MRGLSRYLDKHVNIYNQEGVLLVAGKLEYDHLGFTVNGSSLCHVTKRALCRKKIPGMNGYQLVTRGNYDIFTKPSSKGFKYKF